MILRAQAGRAVVLAAGGQGRPVKRVDTGPIPGGDRDMERLLQLAFAANPEIRLAAGAETGSWKSALVLVGADLHDQDIAERRERLGVKRLAALVVG